MKAIPVFVHTHSLISEDKNGVITIGVNIQPEGPAISPFAMPGSTTFHMPQADAAEFPVGAKLDLTLTPRAK